MSEISQLFIYPIKSLCGVRVHEISFTLGLGLRYDREWYDFIDDSFCSIDFTFFLIPRCMLDKHGLYINGKAYPACHKITLHRFVPPATITLSYKDEEKRLGMR
jgi:uncharacterized protein YcbX